MYDLKTIRSPRPVPLGRKALAVLLCLLLGIGLGLLAKLLDDTPSNTLPLWLEALDLRNFFSRMGVWLFLAVLLAVRSPSPFSAAANVFFFFVGMVASYYWYTIFVIGFYPKAYMMLWAGLTLASPLPALVCWYAKGKGTLSLVIAAALLAVLFRQAFGYGLVYISLSYPLEFLLWIAAILLLHQNTARTLKTIGLSFAFTAGLAFVPAGLFWGVL